jgi:N6-L-threonylcarbamoyladenine synthase
VLADVIHSQVALHAEYGGVVPELAARDHLTSIRPVIEEALARAHVTLSDVDAIAVTNQPGLSGALLIGLEVGRALAFSLDKPLVGVDHLVGHLLAAFVEYPEEAPPEPLKFPLIGLLASGGHTAVYRLDGPLPEQIHQLGGTRDDAAGEAYDKVAKLLGLGYPGGPLIDRLAQDGDPDGVELALPMPDKRNLDVSFSGLKTNVMRYVTEHGIPGNDQRLRDLCASFQRRVVQALVQRALAAAEQEGVSQIVVAGGVAANRSLRAEGQKACEERGLTWIVPSRRASTDNAAMIAFAGSFQLESGADELWSVTMSPKTRLSTRTRKGRGARRVPLSGMHSQSSLVWGRRSATYVYGSA